MDISRSKDGRYLLKIIIEREEFLSHAVHVARGLIDVHGGTVHGICVPPWCSHRTITLAIAPDLLKDDLIEGLLNIEEVGEKFHGVIRNESPEDIHAV